MLFKKLAILLSVIAFAMVLGACPDDDLGGITPKGEKEEQETIRNYTGGDDGLNWGLSSQASVLTLGLNPGNNTTEINLNWYSSGAQAGKVAQVRFVRGTFAAGQGLIEKTGAVDAAGSSTAHKVTVTGLLPDSSYQYAVSSDGNNWSDAYDFKVPAAAGSFKFAVIADPQLTTGNIDVNSRYPAVGTTTAQGWLETMAKIAAANVSFIASGGDQVDASAGNETEYTNFYAPPGLRSLPVAPVSGNHDNHVLFDYHYNLPNRQIFASETDANNQRRNYFYLYNNILFVVLNTAPYPGSKSAAEPYIGRFNQTLTAAKAAHPAYDWLIVQHHKSTASVADHLADRDIQYYVEAGFEKVMSDHNVDFVLAGHDHVYARSYPLQGRDNSFVSVPVKEGFPAASGSTWTNPGNPIYLTFTTGSGLKYYAVAADPYFKYPNGATNPYVKDNTAYPYLGDIEASSVTGQETSTAIGSVTYMTGNYLPVSNAAFVQPYIPSYTIVDVNGKTITFKTYAITTKTGKNTDAQQSYNFDENTPYDSITVTKTN